jgi:predicted RNase H-like nuclease (RuvC/YqgF family)
MTNKTKRESPLIQSVVALDDYLAELERVGERINSTDISSDFDVDYVQKLMTRFAECGENIAQEVTALSARLQEAQMRAQGVAQGVARQAELFTVRQKEQNEKLEEFRIIGEKVRDLNAEIMRVRDDPEALRSKVADFDAQLTRLIEDLQTLRQSARNSRMRTLEREVDSLAQRLQAARKKLQDVNR